MRNALEAAHSREEQLRVDAERASKERDELCWRWNEDAGVWRRREAEVSLWHPSALSRTDKRCSFKRKYTTLCSSFKRTRPSPRFRRNRPRLPFLLRRHHMLTRLRVYNTTPLVPFRTRLQFRLRIPPVHRHMCRHCLRLRPCSLPTLQDLQHPPEVYILARVPPCHPCCGLARDCVFRVGMQDTVDDGRLIRRHRNRHRGADGNDDALKMPRAPRTSRRWVIGTAWRMDRRTKRIFSETMRWRMRF